MKKTHDDIKKQIITALVNQKHGIVSPSTICSMINSNWLTVQKYAKELEDEGVLKVIRVEDRKMVGISLNIKAFLMIDEVLHEMPIEDRLLLETAKYIIQNEDDINSTKGKTQGENIK